MVTADKYLRLLNCNQYLNENIGVYKEAFVKYYGEELRQYIDEQFEKALFIGYISPDDIKTIIIDAEKKKSDEIYEYIISHNNTALAKEDLFKNHSLEFQNIIPLNRYKQFYEQYLLGSEGRRQAFIDEGYDFLIQHVEGLSKDEYIKMTETKELPELYSKIPFWVRNKVEYYRNISNSDEKYRKSFEESKDILYKINPNITIENFYEYINTKEIENLNIMLEKYMQGIDEYDKFMANFSSFKNKVELNEREFIEIGRKYYKKMIEANIDLIAKDKKNGLEEYLKGNEKEYNLDSYIYLLFGYTVYGTSIMEAFTSKAEQILNDDSVEKWKKESIINDRIKYFNENGIDLGNDYSQYLNNMEAKNIWPDAERIDKFITDREKIINACDIEFYESREDFKKIREEINNKDLLDKNDNFDGSLYSSHGTSFVSPNIVKGKNGYELSNLVIIKFNLSDYEIIDHYICHELNHLYECFLEDASAEKYTITSGWDILFGVIGKDNDDELNKMLESKEKRSYELFNEIINEEIAKEISEIMQQEDMNVFCDSKNAKYKNTTEYEHSLFIVEDFYKEYKDSIIESRKEDNIQIIWDEVGKENFDELNQLFHVYYESFQGFKIYSLLQSLANQEDNSDTRKYYEIVDKKNEIMHKMRNHKENSNNISQGFGKA